MMDDSVLESNAKFGKHSLAADTDGSTRDTLDMERMGKQQTLRRNFTFISIFGFSLILMSTWEIQLGVGTFGLTNGGTAGMIYVYLGAWIGFATIAISMAEMASMYAT